MFVWVSGVTCGFIINKKSMYGETDSELSA
jgi:hypothetical protein